MLASEIPVTVVACDRPCRALNISQEASIASIAVERDDFSGAFDRDAYSQQLADVLTDNDVDLVAMAGFGTVLSGTIFDTFGGRIINTHPALLPAFPGWHAVRDALAYGVKVTGCTVHVATSVVDDGPILAQEAVPVLDGDDEATLHERIKVVERRLYTGTIKDILDRGWVTHPGDKPSGA